MNPIPIIRFIFALFTAGILYYPMSKIIPDIEVMFPIAAGSDYGVFILTIWHGVPFFVLFACIYYVIIAVQKRMGIDET